MSAETTIATGERESAAEQGISQSRTALVSIAAAAVLVALKLGTGIIDRKPESRIGGHRVLAATWSRRS